MHAHSYFCVCLMLVNYIISVLLWHIRLPFFNFMLIIFWTIYNICVKSYKCLVRGKASKKTICLFFLFLLIREKINNSRKLHILHLVITLILNNNTLIYEELPPQKKKRKTRNFPLKMERINCHCLAWVERKIQQYYCNWIWRRIDE